MRFINYFLIAVLLTGCTSLFGQEDTTLTPEQVKKVLRDAEQGVAVAQSALGGLYFFGQGVPKDYQLALKWFKRASVQGNARAQFMLGNLYKEGLGVPQDKHESVKWYRRAAEQGYAHGQFSLGVMYYFAEGVPKDHVLSYKWFNLSADQGNKNAAELRDVLATEMTPSQIQEAQKLAREFKPKKEKP